MITRLAYLRIGDEHIIVVVRFKFIFLTIEINFYFRSLAKIEEVRRATKRTAPNDRDGYFVDRKRLSMEGSMRFDQSARFVDPKNNAGSGGHFGSSSTSLNSDYRGSKVSEPVRGSYENHARRFERPPPSSVSTTAGTSVITRRVVQEIANVRRDTRLPPPSPPPPPRDRLDDRRVVDRGRDERYITFFLNGFKFYAAALSATLLIWR